MTAKKIISLLLAILLTLPLAACGKTETYRDDITAASLAETVLKKIPVTDGYDMADTDFLTYYFNSNPAIDDFVFASSAASSDVNEFGILHVNDAAKVDEIRQLAEVYLFNQRDFLSSFLNTYNAAEMAKLEQTQVRVFGNYVIYTILSETDTQAVIAAVEAALKK